MANDPRFKLTYTGGNSPATRTATLTGDGLLLVDTAHWLAQVLPRYHPAVGNGKQSSVRMAEDIFGPSTILSDDVAGWHLHWHLSLSFLANFLLKLEATGKLKWAKLDDVPSARRHIYDVAQNLSAADRTVDQAHVVRTARNACTTTTTFYDQLSAAKLSGGASAAVVFFFRTLVTAYTVAELQDGNGDFRLQLDHVLSCSKSGSTAVVGQAADICVFIRRVLPKGLLWPFVPLAEVTIEASRLTEPEDERFKCEFASGHADVFTVFTSLLPQCLPEVMLSYIGTMLPAGSKVTYSTVKGLCDALVGEDVVSLLDMNENFKSASAAIRAREAAKILAATDGEDEDSKNSKQVRDALKNNAEFKDLTTLLAAHTARQEEPAVTFIMVSSHSCPVGLSWIAGSKVLHSTFQKAGGVKSAEISDKVTDLTLAKDVDGVPQTWQIAVPGQNALLKLAKGQRVDMFQTLALPVILKQRGPLVHAELAHITDATIWTSDRAMRFAEQAFTDIKGIVGETGTSGDSYRAYFRGMHRRCEKLDVLPEWVEEKAGLKLGLNAIGVQAESEYLAHVRELAQQPYDIAKRNKTYIQAGKQCAEMVKKFDTVLATVLARAELSADFGTRRDGSRGGGGGGSAAQHIAGTSSLLSYSATAGTALQSKDLRA